MKLATALSGVGNGGLPLFRGVRDGSRVDAYQFWSVHRDYAATYGGEIVEAELCGEAGILDLRECLTADGLYDGEAIDAACPGLAEAMGIDADTVIERSRLWDCCHDEHAAAVEVIRAAGYRGWRWYEGGGDDEAFCLLVEAR